VAQATAPSILESPYVGLTFFAEENAELFFGRDAERAVIITNLRASRLTLLYAESGVGKSSLLHAGVAADLRRQADVDLAVRGSPRFVPVVFSSWSEDPIAGLIAATEEAIRPFLPEGGSLELQRGRLDDAMEQAADAVDAAMFVILDQFEEYFLYRGKYELEDAFPDQLARCVHRPELRTNFLISIREDVYAGLGNLFRGTIDNVYANFLHLDYLDRDAARDAIERPIARLNESRQDDERFEIEPELVSAILDDPAMHVGVAPDSANGGGTDAASARRRDVRIETTYLQLVLRRLWDEEIGAGSRVLRLETLERLHGAQAIISTHLDRAMAQLSPGEQDAAASIFSFLVTRGGTKIALTAKDLSEMAQRTEAELAPVLRRLAAGDLHILRPVPLRDPSAGASYEISHDALARPIVAWRTSYRDEQKQAAEKARREQLAAQIEQERREKEEAQQQALEAEAREAHERRRKIFALIGVGVLLVAFIGTAATLAVLKANDAARAKNINRSVESGARINALSSSPNFGPSAAAVAGVEALHRFPSTFEARNDALAPLQINAAMPKIAVGHTRPALGVAFLPGSSVVASGSADGTIRLWNLSGGQLGPPLVDESIDQVWSVAVPKSGHVLVAARGDGAVDIWDVASVYHTRRLQKLHAGSTAYLVAFSPNGGHWLAAGGDDGIALWRWNAKDPGRPGPRHFVNGLGSVYALTFNSSGQELVFAGDEGVGRLSVSRVIHSRNQPKPRWLTRETDALSVAAAGDGSVAAGIDDSSAPGIRVWQRDGRKPRFFPTTDVIESLAFSRDGRTLVAGGDDWNVTTWNVRTGTQFGPPRLHQGDVNGVALSADGQTIASAGDDRFVKIWNLNPPAPLAMTIGSIPARYGSGWVGSGSLPAISDLAASRHGWLAAAGWAGGAFLWRSHGDQSTHRTAPLIRIPATVDEPTEAVAYRGDDLIVTRGKSFRVFNAGPSCQTMPQAVCARTGLVRPPGSATPRISELALNRTGAILAAGYANGRVRLWDISRPDKPKHLWQTPRGKRAKRGVDALAFSPTADLLAVGADDGTLWLWNVRDPREPFQLGRPFFAHEHQMVSALAFSPSGTHLATGGGDQQVALWHVDPRKGVTGLPNRLYQSNTILSLAFSHDGKILASGDGDGDACIYDVTSLRLIGSSNCLQGPHSDSNLSGVQDLVFIDGGKTLLSAGDGTPVVAWNSLLWSQSDDRNKSLAQAACRLAGRNLTAGEWSNVFSSGTIRAPRRTATCPQYPLP
jgi:WD40 repeat protein